MCVHIYKHSFEKAPEGAQSRRPETYASTGSSRRCEHIFLPKLPLNYLQEPFFGGKAQRHNATKAQQSDLIVGRMV